ncbi:MAG: prepilin peptidase [Desulfobacterales bacterium]|nr:prepilin peptidase [Desulfobacterales bacterium]
MNGAGNSLNLFVPIIANALLLALILSASVTDIWKNKIYNCQTYPAMAAGFFLGFLFSGIHGLLFSIGGLGLGIAILLIFFLLGGLGAGDVKLLGAIGALKGPEFVVWTMFYTGLAGGAVAFAVIIWRGTFLQTFMNIGLLLRHPLMFARSPEAVRTDADDQALQYLPYGCVISAGSLLALFIA